MDEILGLETGVNGGFSGSQCFSDEALRFHATAVVGGLIGVATGAALAVSLRGGKEIVVCCVGDAATEQGVFWESINFAALHRLPIAYVCENNEWSVHTHISERQARPIAPRVSAFGVRVCGSIEDAVYAARHTGAPSFAEVRCERLCAHVRDMDDLRHVR